MFLIRLLPTIIVSFSFCFVMINCGGTDKATKKVTCASNEDCNESEQCVTNVCVECKTKSDCDNGDICLAGACVQQKNFCMTSADCSTLKACVQNKCVDCVSTSDCSSGQDCLGGACIGNGNCQNDLHCLDDENCENNRCTRTTLSMNNDINACTFETIYFAFDEFILTEASRQKLDSNFECIISKDRPFYVIGHTDSVGTEEYNIALSDSRARTAAKYLKNLGVDKQRIHILPKGENEAQNTDFDGSAEDRRVEFAWK